MPSTRANSRHSAISDAFGSSSTGSRFRLLRITLSSSRDTRLQLESGSCTSISKPECRAKGPQHRVSDNYIEIACGLGALADPHRSHSHSVELTARRKTRRERMCPTSLMDLLSVESEFSGLGSALYHASISSIPGWQGQQAAGQCCAAASRVISLPQPKHSLNCPVTTNTLPIRSSRNGSPEP